MSGAGLLKAYAGTRNKNVFLVHVRYHIFLDCNTCMCITGFLLNVEPQPIIQISGKYVMQIEIILYRFNFKT
jgi:hypothetical protein